MFKFVISVPKENKSVQIEKDAPTIVGMRIGSKFDGSITGLTGYTLQVTGGSDKEGFPMRKDLQGTARKKILAVNSTGCRGKIKGMKSRKSVRGNTISQEMVQINVKVIEKGAKSVEELLGLVKEESPKEESGKSEPKTEIPKDEPKNEKPKKEEPVEEEAPNEEPKTDEPAKEEPKAEVPKEETKKEEKKEEPKD